MSLLLILLVLEFLFTSICSRLLFLCMFCQNYCALNVVYLLCPVVYLSIQICELLLCVGVICVGLNIWKTAERDFDGFVFFRMLHHDLFVQMFLKLLFALRLKILLKLYNYLMKFILRNLFARLLFVLLLCFQKSEGNFSAKGCGCMMEIV